MKSLLFACAAAGLGLCATSFAVRAQAVYGVQAAKAGTHVVEPGPVQVLFTLS